MNRKTTFGLCLAATVAIVLAMIGPALAAPQHSIAVNQADHGAILPLGANGVVTVDDGADQHFTIIPNVGYHIVDVEVDGVGQGALTDYTFELVTANHTITAIFLKNEPATGSTWYLAEGTNAWGFTTYISIENPCVETLHAKVTYMDPHPYDTGVGRKTSGIALARVIELPPLSQTKVSSLHDIGVVDFSTKVECLEKKPIAVDRTMYWVGAGSIQAGYHTSIGANRLSRNWYLPEGSSESGFETWTEVLNPNPEEATVTLTYMCENAAPKIIQRTIKAHARATYLMSTDMGTANASLQVTSDVPVAAERSMYHNNRREGSCSVGATVAATDCYLSEGAVGYPAGFMTYIVIQNPGSQNNNVTISYQTGAGTIAGPSFTMLANSRKTVKVNDTVPGGTDVSTHVHGSQPLVAERSMYWNNGKGEAFHSSIGIESPHMIFVFPDGQTNNGWETWTLVSNTNPDPVVVRITYLPENGAADKSFVAVVPAGSRRSYSMANKITGRASILVESLDGARPVMVERTMYLNDRAAGTNTIGGFSD